MADPRDYVWMGPAFFAAKFAMALFMDWMQKREKDNV